MAGRLEREIAIPLNVIPLDSPMLFTRRIEEVDFRSLKENIDTGSSAGKLQFHIF